jgi:V8-like Glu-specific endopeptidase
MRKFVTLSVSMCALFLCAASPTYAQTRTEPLSITNPDATGKAVREFWTPERFKAAQPLPMPQIAPGSEPKSDEPTAAPGKVESSEPRAPSQQLRGPGQRLYSPDTKQDQATQAERVATPSAVGTLGAHYTSTRVFPMFAGTNAFFSADRTYPYTTVGKLFFSVGGRPFVCSASVIQLRVVATAGHCVHSGNGGASGFHANFLFVPAFRDGAAPLLTWNWSYAIVTATWAFGGGGVPNAADYALIEFADQGNPLRKLGNVTGWLGWQTLSLSANHTSKLGYPCNLDSCQKMQNVTSASFRNTSPNNVEYGSDALGGSSGGPWVQNFQIIAAGGGLGSNTGSNRVVGVTSYIYTSPDPKAQGASILDNRWVDIWNTICARSGNCM